MILYIKSLQIPMFYLAAFDRDELETTHKTKKLHITQVGGGEGGGGEVFTDTCAPNVIMAVPFMILSYSQGTATRTCG